ncbi:D-alanine--poly(phosphoribitol) ligase subunit DltA [Desulfosporosinus meridiei]|uniref:Non-ribosomal peptide synthase n=1 Tax=Desulfosporosinus meridiei (strain ATCC BAA-275 / DSM 13257 / KCTC 12902 / NCIMB 13706 / S10) TaxID=768704 RepID=J7IWM6_DESMD|nr:D-alanine--poly(phosphoribitol) ligase subunit DltA [Desulfosporosinus meridiei]AFQ46135.1 non-ribosomal peptide synthase [Desulfosporosinus meridiei DSM 13257]
MLSQKIQEWSIRCPERAAHCHGDNVLTYAALESSANAAAVWLHELSLKQGIPRQTPVVVYGHKENEMPVLFMACIRAGHPYIPVDSSVPQERLWQIIEASGARVVLSPQMVPKGDASSNVLIKEMISLKGQDSILKGYQREAPHSSWQVELDEVYYIIFTSGSTGVPKGVQITLGALESFLNWVNTEFQPEEMQEVFLNQAPFSFDLSVMDLYMSLSTGGTLWSVDKDQISHPKELFASLAASKTSYWVSTPSFAEVCLMDPSFNAALLPMVKRFLFCGEILTHDCATKLTQRFPQAKVENLYGPTEATVAVTNLTISPEILNTFNPLPVGRVKPDAQVLICNSDQLNAAIIAEASVLHSRPEILPEGEAGELVIAGPNVSVGYLNNSEQTAKAFFSWQEKGQTWNAYRTGDSGLFKNGFLFYQGRLDFQIKLHGYRIELGEIEENLRRNPLVDNAVVLPIERRGKVEYLQAFVTVSKPVEDEFQEILALKEDLRGRLPEYMIPRRVKFLAAMPITPNGKADRRALLGGL